MVPVVKITLVRLLQVDREGMAIVVRWERKDLTAEVAGEAGEAEEPQEAEMVDPAEAARAAQEGLADREERSTAQPEVKEGVLGSEPFPAMARAAAAAAALTETVRV